jgi:hypothetical protein
MNRNFGWGPATRFGLASVTLLALASTAAAAMTVEEVVATSKKTGKPILVVGGTKT